MEYVFQWYFGTNSMQNFEMSGGEDGVNKNYPEQMPLANDLYEMFFFTGLFWTLVTGCLMIIYRISPSMKQHPNSILHNILLIQFVVSLKYLVTGLTFKIYDNDINYTPKMLMDFGFMDFGCKIEGILAYILFFYIIVFEVV